MECSKTWQHVCYATSPFSRCARWPVWWFWWITCRQTTMLFHYTRTPKMCSSISIIKDHLIEFSIPVLEAWPWTPSHHSGCWIKHDNFLYTVEPARSKNWILNDGWVTEIPKVFCPAPQAMAFIAFSRNTWTLTLSPAELGRMACTWKKKKRENWNET